MSRKKILAVPEGDIFLERDVEILRNHFEVRTAPTFNRKKPQIELSQNSLSSTGLCGKPLSSMDCTVIAGDRTFYDLGGSVTQSKSIFDTWRLPHHRTVIVRSLGGRKESSTLTIKGQGGGGERRMLCL